MQNAANSRSEAQFWLNKYKEIGYDATFCQSNDYFLIYEIGTNIILHNVNFPIEEIPTNLISYNESTSRVSLDA